MRHRLCGLVASASLIAFAVAANCDDKKPENKIPDEARAVLEKAGQIELLSLDPAWPKVKPKDDFHGWKVLDKAVVKDADARKKLVAAFVKGVDQKVGLPPCEFEPRHGLRATHDGKTADFVIGFDCNQSETYLGEKKAAGFSIAGAPAVEFDKALKDAKVLPQTKK